MSGYRAETFSIFDDQEDEDTREWQDLTEDIKKHIDKKSTLKKTKEHSRQTE